MPHLIYEYTDNLANENIAGLLQKSAKVLVNQGSVFPVGGIRVRAYRINEYVIADGTNHDDAFVHATLKIGKGRSQTERQKVCDDLFALMCEHFAEVFNKRGLALSLEYNEFTFDTRKKNNIHLRYKPS